MEIGSNVVARPRKNRNKIKGSNKSNGLYIPAVVSDFSTQSIDKASQFRMTKMIIDFLASFNNIETVIKGLKRHKFHEELEIYIKRKSFINLSYTSVGLNEALSKQPRFVILDTSATPLLQVLASYSGPIFLLLKQPPLVKKDALQLLKRRVMISKSVDELESQLKLFTEVGKLKEVNLMDNAFMDVYCKPFNYSNN